MKERCTSPTYSHEIFRYSVFDSLPRFRNKIKMSVQKMMKTFSPNSGVATSLPEIVDDKKWRSDWFIIKPSKRSWYMIERYTGSLMKKPFRLRRKKINFIGLRMISITFTLSTRKSFGLQRPGWTTTLWMQLKN